MYNWPKIGKFSVVAVVHSLWVSRNEKAGIADHCRVKSRASRQNYPPMERNYIIIWIYVGGRSTSKQNQRFIPYLRVTARESSSFFSFSNANEFIFNV